MNFVYCSHQEWPAEDDKDVLYWVMKARPCKGILHVTADRPYFVRGKIEVQGSKEGEYPKHFLEMIDHVFGKQPNTIEVCSRTVQVDSIRTAFTVDSDTNFKPSLVADATVLPGVESNRFERWRCDPPYNEKAAEKKYQSDLPRFIDLLKAGARVCKVGSLMFLLLGPTNYQWHPPGVMRVGLIYLSVVPNNETRALNIYYKYSEV